MTELDELETMIEDEQASSKGFYISATIVSLTGAPIISLLNKASSLTYEGILQALGGKGWFYALALVVFTIAATCVVNFLIQSCKKKHIAISKIRTIKQQHQYEPQGSNS